MIGAMQTGTASVVQLRLPFEGLQDRVRNAAEIGRVVMLARARDAMRRYNISDVLVIRALRRCLTANEIRGGGAKGEWRCSVSFSVRGFRSGGIVSVLLKEGRIFVEDFVWDQQP